MVEKWVTREFDGGKQTCTASMDLMQHLIDTSVVSELGSWKRVRSTQYAVRSTEYSIVLQNCITIPENARNPGSLDADRGKGTHPIH